MSGTRNRENIPLLEYYSELASHHRVMMIGFVSVYFFINQALLVTTPNSLPKPDITEPLLVVLSAGLLVLLVVAGTLHHACHFCSAGAMKAMMAATVHFNHLPRAAEQDSFDHWLAATTDGIRKTMAVPTASVYILGVIFAGLIAVNTLVFYGIAYALLNGKALLIGAVFGGFLTLQASVVLYYGFIFFMHFRCLRAAKRDLGLVLRANTRDQAEKAIAQRLTESVHHTGLGSLFSLD